MTRKKCPHCEIPVTPTAADVCPFCSRTLGDISEIDAATLAEMAKQSDAARRTAADKARASAKEDRRRIGRKIGFGLGMVVGYFVWQMKVGGLGGLILAVFIAIIIEEVFTAIFCAMDGVRKRPRDASEIANLLSQSRTTSDSAACATCDYSGIMIIKRRRNALLLLLLQIPAIFAGGICAGLLIQQGLTFFALLIFPVVAILPLVLTSRTAVVCPRCDGLLRKGT